MTTALCLALLVASTYADSGSSGCGGPGVLTNPTGSFMSHAGYVTGSLYPTSASCSWTIVAPTGYMVRVTFPDGINIEKSTNCVYDYIGFYDGTSATTSPSIGAYCGTGSLGPIVSTGSSMLVKFYSDPIVPAYGFRANYDFIPKTAVAACLSTQFACASDKKCIRKEWACDGIKDCSDGSDEASCSAGTTKAPAVVTTPARQPVITNPTTKPAAAATAAPVSQLTGACGVADYPHKVGNTRIVGGVEVTRNSWPWQAMVRYQGSYVCGGSLINNQWVLTAAHCFEDSIKTPSQWSISLGKHNTYKTDVGELLVKAIKVVEHPSYNIRTTDNDIALIKLERSITFNDKIKPVCLPTAEATANTLCYATGWGETQGTGAATVLKQAALPIMSRSSCTSYLGSSFMSSMICAGYTQGGHDTCSGDSGGPLVCASGGKYQLQGITSWGSTYCAGAYYPGVYTRVVNYVQWIQDTMAKN